MAVDTFHTEIAAAGTKVKELVLKLAMRSPSGEIVWAMLRPDQWSDMVQDGDSIRVEGNAEASELRYSSPTVTFNWFHSGNVTALLPQSYEASHLRNKQRWTKSSKLMYRSSPRVQRFLSKEYSKHTMTSSISKYSFHAGKVGMR